ncbi:hypothetical protein PF008_g11347 [Phytophthora fragariae]|uniref:RxLR effector protein n=1 Tax=Phytophthora fragariae TaxID=53985 RepID=A0A6G0RR52_9STRA|nr:hypothetical protein PF008_g11347 [Phytophthora fragariae]
MHESRFNSPSSAAFLTLATATSICAVLAMSACTADPHPLLRADANLRQSLCCHKLTIQGDRSNGRPARSPRRIIGNALVPNALPVHPVSTPRRSPWPCKRRAPGRSQEEAAPASGRVVSSKLLSNRSGGGRRGLCRPVYGATVEAHVHP